MTTNKPAAAATERTSRLAFSYQRVSTGKQATEGSAGIDRQADAFLPFCQRHGLTPNPDPLVDEGLSAFHGRHRNKGALGAFIHAAQQGQIPSGSVLVVEDLDRFSREAASHSERLLHALWDEGLALGIVRDDVVVDRARYDADLGIRVMLTVRRDAAHDYSQKLSGRIEDVWARRRAAAADGRKYPAARPFWCDWNPVLGDFTLNDQAVIPRLMVRLSIEGMGLGQIARHLNQQGFLTTTGKPFTQAWVRRVLTNRALLGEKQFKGDEAPLQGYFPALISEAEWQKCWSAITTRASHKGRVGRGTHIYNLFQGVIHCECGGALTFISTYNQRIGRRYNYLRCMGKVSGTCTAGRKNPTYDEEWLLRAFMEQRWSSYFSRPANTKQRRHLEGLLLEVEAQLRQQRERAGLAQRNMEELLASGKLDATTALMIGQGAQAAEQQAADLAQRRDAVQLQLEQLLAQPTGQEAAQQIKERAAAFMAGDREDLEQRRKFNNWLHTLGLRLVLAAVRDRWFMSVEPLQKATTTSSGDAHVEGLEIHVPMKAGETLVDLGEVDLTQFETLEEATTFIRQNRDQLPKA